MQNFINRCLREGAQIIDSRTLSDCPIPSMHRPWEVGCYLRIPDNPTVMRDVNFGLFIPITVTFADGLSTVDNLFLTTFTISWKNVSSLHTALLLNLCNNSQIGTKQLKPLQANLSKSFPLQITRLLTQEVLLETLAFMDLNFDNTFPPILLFRR